MAEWRVQELSGIRCKSCERTIQPGEDFALLTQYKRSYCEKCCERLHIARDEPALVKERRRLEEAFIRHGDPIPRPPVFTPMDEIVRRFKEQILSRRTGGRS